MKNRQERAKNLHTMVCVKQLNVVGGSVSNLTIGKQYSVSLLPLAVLPFQSMDEHKYKKVMVWGDDINSDYQYPIEAFVTIEEWRELQIGKIL